VYIWIVPESLGQIPIEVRAVSNAAGDAVRRLLLVKVLSSLHFYSHFNSEFLVLFLELLL